MDIEPASIDQLRRDTAGRWHIIPVEDSHIVKEIYRINNTLKVRYSEAGRYFVVYQEDPDTKTQSLVTTAQHLDERLVKRIEKITSPQYDLAAEMDELDTKVEKDAEHKFEEQVGEIGERLHFAMRKDLRK